MTGVVKSEFISPKKGKENKNSSNHIPVPCRKINRDSDIDDKTVRDDRTQEDEIISSTSRRSVRPQTKILRRPTPNLKHPVIQMDSDDSSGDSSCSDKSKEDNPKRLKMGSESSSSDSGHKPKNFIIYNKYNVEKNTIKSSPKERSSAGVVPTIPNPCNSCNRSLAPERLHSHAKKDARGLMYRKSPSLDIKMVEQKTTDKPSKTEISKSPTLDDVKMASPKKKVLEASNRSPVLDDVKMTSPKKKVLETSNRSQTMDDVKMASPKKKVIETSSTVTKATLSQKKISEPSIKSPTLDVRMASPRKKVSDDIKITYPNQKLSKLIVKSASMDFKSQKLSEAMTKQTSGSKPATKLKLLDRDPKLASSHQKVTEATIKSQLLDVQMTSPKLKVSRTPPYKVLNRISKQCSSAEDNSVSAQDNSISAQDNNSVSGESLLVPDCDSEKEVVEPKKPCYVCQKEFKVSVLLLHESKCLETWKKENNSLTPNLRQLPPRRPPDDEDNSYDEDSLPWSSVQSQLVPCQLCGRTFFPERLPVHRRVCKGKTSPRPLKRATSLREKSVSSVDGDEQKPAAPLYVPCYVCGRNFGSWVISMHEQQCLKKWRRENEKLPDEERQEEPKMLQDFSLEDDVASLVELGDNAWESHLQHLVPCPLCSRTFFPDRLGIHKRSCKGSQTCSSKRPGSNKGV